MKLLHVGLSAADNPPNGLQKAFSKVFDEVAEIKTAGDNSFNKRVIALAEEFRPDVVWMQVQAENIIQHSTITKLKELGAFTMNWTGDVRNSVPTWMLQAGKYIDLTLFSNYNDVEECHRKGIQADYLQIGFDPEIYNPKKQVNDVMHSIRPIVFLANNYGSQFPLGNLRKEVALRLYREFTLDFGLYGNGWQWPKATGTHMGNQLAEAACYRRAKIAINCSHFDRTRYSSDRMFRIMGSGALCLTKWYPGIEKDFQDGENVVVWHTIDEMASLCRKYLSPEYEQERKRIAENGCSLVHSRDTFEHMVMKIKNLYLKYK